MNIIITTILNKLKYILSITTLAFLSLSANAQSLGIADCFNTVASFELKLAGIGLLIVGIILLLVYHFKSSTKISLKVRDAGYAFLAIGTLCLIGSFSFMLIS